MANIKDLYAELDGIESQVGKLVTEFSNTGDLKALREELEDLGSRVFEAVAAVNNISDALKFGQ